MKDWNASPVVGFVFGPFTKQMTAPSSSVPERT